MLISTIKIIVWSTLTLDDLEKSYQMSKHYDRHISAEWKDIDLKIGEQLGNEPVNVTGGKNAEFWETTMAAER